MKSPRSFAVTSLEVLPPRFSAQVPAMHILSKGEEGMLRRAQNFHVQ